MRKDIESKLGKLYVDAIFNADPEMLQGKVKVNETAKENYKKTLMLLSELKGKGKCNFTYDAISIPYVMHCINVQWNFDCDGYLELDSKKIASILDKMEGIVIDKQNENEWQLSSTIYVQEKE